MNGWFLKETLENARIGTDCLVMDDSVYTTLAFVSLDKEGQRQFSFSRNPGADTMIKKEELDVSSLTACKVFHIGSLSTTNEPSRGATIFAVEAAKRAGCIISYDPNYRKALWKTEDEAIKQMRAWFHI
jgi:fructokinase